MQKRARKAEFPPKERRAIENRDECCIFCKMEYHMEKATWMDCNVLSIMHYIPRSRGGLGVERNAALGCYYHHTMLDNGNTGRREEMLGLFKDYLMQQYEDWNEEELTYDKWSFLQQI